MEPPKKGIGRRQPVNLHIAAWRTVCRRGTGAVGGIGIGEV
jgi:hypothetical protein